LALNQRLPALFSVEKRLPTTESSESGVNSRHPPQNAAIAASTRSLQTRADAAERGLSAYVAEALRFKRDRDRLQELVEWLQAENGPATEGEGPTWQSAPP
jgi:hypothetical protein